jgi:hypothetical protein
LPCRKNHGSSAGGLLVCIHVVPYLNYRMNRYRKINE